MPQVARQRLDVHKVAVTSAVAPSFVILPASSLAEIGHGRKLGGDLAPAIHAPRNADQRALRIALVPKANVDVSDHVVRDVVADGHGLDLAEAGELLEEVFVEGLFGGGRERG
jgi:hypothetical protein